MKRKEIVPLIEFGVGHSGPIYHRLIVSEKEGVSP